MNCEDAKSAYSYVDQSCVYIREFPVREIKLTPLCWFENERQRVHVQQCLCRSGEKSLL